jgi:urease accessory protein UreE
VLTDGTPFYIEGDACYVLEQLPEAVLEITVSSIREAAHVAWNLGNLHFGVEVRGEVVRVAPDDAVRQFLAREKIAFRQLNAIFLPLSGGAHHPHDPSHHHHG